MIQNAERVQTTNEPKISTTDLWILQNLKRYHYFHFFQIRTTFEL